ncbi:MAG: MerR family transcriptional regulator [Rectinema sp.]
MGSYSTGQVERLLGLPASTLRFWEKEVSFLAPRKDVFGRRVYSAADLCVLARLKHLALDNGLGLQVASRELETEMSAGDQGDKAVLTELRSDLLALYAEADDLAKRIESAGQNGQKRSI